MNIIDWAKQNKVAAAAIGGGGLLLILHKGHTANNISSSDGTADGAPADGEHVQLVPVSSAPSESTDTSSGGSDGISDTGNTSGGTDPSSTVEGPLGGLVGEIGGDINSPLLPAPNPTPASVIPTPNDNGVATSGAIAAAAATAAATRPSGHPGYKTVIRDSAKHGGTPYVYHERLSDHKMIPVRPASHKPRESAEVKELKKRGINPAEMIYVTPKGSPEGRAIAKAVQHPAAAPTIHHEAPKRRHR